MPLYQDEGVVLRTAKLGEADRILTLLTRDHGKVRAVAKGVRRTKSRFGGRLEPFMRVALLIAEGRSLDVVSQAESIAAYAGPICADFQAYTAANVICETADNLVATEKEPADHTPESEAVSWDAICRLSALVDGDWGELDGVPAAASIQRETHQIVEEWGEYYLERPIRSMRLLD